MGYSFESLENKNTEKTIDSGGLENEDLEEKRTLPGKVMWPFLQNFGQECDLIISMSKKLE